MSNEKKDGVAAKAQQERETAEVQAGVSPMQGGSSSVAKQQERVEREQMKADKPTKAQLEAAKQVKAEKKDIEKGADEAAKHNAEAGKQAKFQEKALGIRESYDHEKARSERALQLAQAKRSPGTGLYKIRTVVNPVTSASMELTKAEIKERKEELLAEGFIGPGLDSEDSEDNDLGPTGDIAPVGGITTTQNLK